VVKKKLSAEAVAPSISTSAKAVKKQGIRRIIILLLEDWGLPKNCSHRTALLRAHLVGRPRRPDSTPVNRYGVLFIWDKSFSS